MYVYLACYSVSLVESRAMDDSDLPKDVEQSEIVKGHRWIEESAFEFRIL